MNAVEFRVFESMCKVAGIGDMQKIALSQQTVRSAFKKMITNAAAHRTIDSKLEHGVTTALYNQSLARAQSMGYKYFKKFHGGSRRFKQDWNLPYSHVSLSTRKSVENKRLWGDVADTVKTLKPGSDVIGKEQYTQAVIAAIKKHPVGKSNVQKTGWPYREIVRPLNSGMQPANL